MQTMLSAFYSQTDSRLSAFVLQLSVLKKGVIQDIEIAFLLVTRISLEIKRLKEYS